MKKTKISVIIAVLSALCVCFIMTGCAVKIGDEKIPANTTELDLSGSVIEDETPLGKLQKLRKLDIRDTGITSQQFDHLTSMLPDCDIIWSVPIGTEYFDSDITEFSFAAEYVDDLENIRYFTAVSDCDVTGTRADDERMYELASTLYPEHRLIWTVNVNGEEMRTDSEELDLTGIKKLSDPSFIKYFRDLKTLRLGDKKITDLSMLEDMTGLEVLDLSGNSISDISAIAGMKDLKELNLENTYADAKKDLSVLEGLGIERLDLKTCGGENYEVVTTLGSLKALDMSYYTSPDDDYSFLADIASGIEELTLDASGLRTGDIKYLSGLTSLKKLSLRYVYISDASSLYGLGDLEELVISDDGLDKDQLKELAEKLPGCNIVTE